MKKWLDFDDVLLLPRKSDVYSREQVDTSVQLDSGSYLKIPVIASPMKGIINRDFVSKLSDYGIIGILHRFYDDQQERFADIKYLADNRKRFGVAVGLDEVNSHVTNYALDYGADIICIDIANGYLPSLYKATEILSSIVTNEKYTSTIMTGNVVTYEGARNLYDAGADYIRVGIGSGALCTTRLVTGVGCPQITAISNCMDINNKWKVVADGGIRTSGDIVKALAFGAEVVMVGSILAKTEESAHNGIIYGMASEKLQDEYYHNTKSIEGIEKSVEKTTTLGRVLDEISWGIKSACTYLNASSLRELRNNVDYIEKG